MLVLQDQEWLQIWEKCSYAHRQVYEQHSERSKKNDDKSAVAMLKKYDLHDRTWQPVVNRDKMLNENDKDGRVAILMVTGYAQGPCAKELQRKGVKQSRARCPTDNRKNERF